MIIEKLDELLEIEWDKTAACIEKLRKQYPDSIYKQTIHQIIENKLERYNKHIQEKRENYNKLATFIEKQSYYNSTLKRAEEGYKLAVDSLNRYLHRLEPYPYENWVTPIVYQFMRENGYYHTVELYIDIGRILQ